MQPKNKDILVLMALAMPMLWGCAGITNNPSETAVVIVGMENSKAYGKCPGCANDVSKMKSILSPYSKHVTILQDGQATKANVRNALVQGASKKTLIFYYSGHGGQAGKGDASEADKKDEYLCLYDGSFLDNELWSVATGAKGKVMYIIDACHSGTMYRSIVEQIDDTAKTIRGDTPNLLCWSGCRDEQYSYADNSGGYFTKALNGAYKSRFTYGKVWDRISSNMNFPADQKPQKTQLGKGWGTFVFH